MTTCVLVLYYSQHGATAGLAKQIARGVGTHGDATAMLRTVPPVRAATDERAAAVPDSGAPYVTHADLRACDALALGSPTRFGNMAAALKAFLDSTSALWMEGALIDKPACVFTSSASPHGGQESTLWSMMVPLMHHGMVLAGVPYTEEALNRTTGGGTPYGPSHVARDQRTTLIDDEKAVALAAGERLARLAVALKMARGVQ
ncbi:MAG: NAD(P)H:quinone oxidoreductase [Gammaproteobacteria bacterium]